jgi:hypothetical protein
MAYYTSCHGGRLGVEGPGLQSDVGCRWRVNTRFGRGCVPIMARSWTGAPAACSGAGGHLTTCPDWPGPARSENRRLQPSVRRRCTGKPPPRWRNGIPIRQGGGSRNQRGCRSKRFRENRLSSVYPLVDVRRQWTIARCGHQPRPGPASELTARRLVAVWSRAGVWAGRPGWAGWWAPSPD